MWACIATPKRQEKSLWRAAPSVEKINSLSHSLDPKGTFPLPVYVPILLAIGQSGNFLLYLVVATIILSHCNYITKSPKGGDGKRATYFNLG